MLNLTFCKNWRKHQKGNNFFLFSVLLLTGIWNITLFSWNIWTNTIFIHSLSIQNFVFLKTMLTFREVFDHPKVCQFMFRGDKNPKHFQISFIPTAQQPLKSYQRSQNPDSWKSNFWNTSELLWKVIHQNIAPDILLGWYNGLVFTLTIWLFQMSTQCTAKPVLATVT